MFLGNPMVMSGAAIIAVFLLYNVENYWGALPFAVLIVALISALLFAVSKRPAFSVYSAFMIVGLVTVVSLIKFKMKGFSLHFYDIVFAGSDPQAAEFLLSTYPHLIVPVLVFAASIAVASTILFLYDEKLERSRSHLMAGVLLPAIMLPVTYPTEAREGRYVYYLQGRHASAFFVSLLDIQYMFSDGEMERRLAAAPPQKPFSKEALCGSNSPDIFVVLSETQADPAKFPQLENGKEIGQRMAEANGPLQPLNVETFGGGTWITNLSFLTGLPATEFGWRSPYLTIELEGKVRGALPELLSKCGYRTVAIMPFEQSFVNEGPFLSSIGFEEVYDKEAIGASDYRMRDTFYYSAAEKIIADKKEGDNRPLFLLIQTMYPHSPYEKRRDPEIVLKGEPFNDDPQIAEYLRRMLIARQDLAGFLDKRRKQLGSRGAVFMDFGDHQSFSTKPLVEAVAGDDAMSKPGSLPYQTFYTMRYVKPDGEQVMKDQKPVDIAFLGSRLLQFAGLPTSEMWSDIARLDALCEGKMFTCANKQQVINHLRRRIDSGVLDIKIAER